MKPKAGHLIVGATIACLLQAACTPSPPLRSPTPSHSGTPTSHATYTFVCCYSPALSQQWRPGETVSIQWRPKPGQPTTSGAAFPVHITAQLYGPYPSVGALKAADTGQNSAPIVASGLTNTDDWTGVPMSVSLTVPGNIAPAYYDLVCTSRYRQTTVSSAEVIQVVA